jgi:hypothetical protein
VKINEYSDFCKFEIIHIFEYFDFPLFFISKSPSDEYYMNYYIEEIAENVDKWFFGRISRKECRDLIEQRLSVIGLLKRLYNQKRLYYLIFHSNINRADTKFDMELVDESNFDQESFPKEDFFVEYDYVTKKKLVKIEEDYVDYIDTSRFKMILKDSYNSHDIGLDTLLDILGNLKRTINDIASDIGSKILGKNSINKINLRVDSLQPSSFGIWLKTEPSDIDLFEVPEKTLNNLFEFIDDLQYKTPVEIEERIEIDEEYSVETIKSLNNLLKSIVENDFSLTLEAVTKSNKINKQVKFDKNSYSKLSILANILSKKNEKYSEKIEIEGILTSVNTTNNHYRISTKTGDISGKMSTELFKRLKNDPNIKFIVPSKIRATVLKETVKDHVKGEYYEKFILIHFDQPEY